MRLFGQLLLIVIVGVLLLPTNTFAAANPTPTGTCQPIFGGGQTCVSSGNLIVNKTVKSPSSDTFVDNLGPDNAFSPNQSVTFRIIVTNNNNSTLSKVTVNDYFPDFLTFTSGPGTFDASKHQLTYTIDKLEGNETKSLTIQAQIAGSDALPQNQPLTCLPNQVEVKAGARRSTDNVQFCVQTGNGEVQGSSTQNQNPPKSGFAQFTATPTPVKTQPATTPNTTKGGTPLYPTPSTTKTPDTGPELLGLAALLPLGGSGLFLRKKSKRS